MGQHKQIESCTFVEKDNKDKEAGRVHKLVVLVLEHHEHHVCMHSGGSVLVVGVARGR